jgi:predicted RNA-binding protein YlqC (UPF0109 family)
VNAEPNANIFELISKVVTGMCCRPNDLVIREEGARLVIIPHTSDYRVICGKQGRQIRALKLLVDRMAARAKCQYQIELHDGYSGPHEAIMAFQPNPEFNFAEATLLVSKFLNALFERPIIVKSSIMGHHLVILVDANNDELPYIYALGDVFYPYGFRQGCLLKVKPNGYHDTRGT